MGILDDQLNEALRSNRSPAGRRALATASAAAAVVSAGGSGKRRHPKHGGAVRRNHDRNNWTRAQRYKHSDEPKTASAAKRIMRAARRAGIVMTWGEAREAAGRRRFV